MVLEDVQPGQRVASSLSASSWNLHNAAARAHQQRGGVPRQVQRQAGIGVDPRDGNVIKVRNSSGADQPQFAVLGIDDFLVAPGASENTQRDIQFRQQPWLECVEPAATHWGRFVVLLDGLKDGEIGRAAVAGCTLVKVDVQDEKHTHAEVKAGDATQLTSAASGSARILQKEAGTGTKWAVVNLGVVPDVPLLGKLTASAGAAGDEDNDCAFTYTLADLAGNQLATGLTPKRPRFPKTTYTAAPVDSCATYTHDGTNFILLDAIEEWPQSDNCDEGA